MKFSLLGPLAVHGDSGQSLTPRPRKLRELLALLLLNADQTVVADRLLEHLWDSAPPKTGRTALQVYVSQLRSHFEHAGVRPARDILATEPAGYALRLHQGELDLANFDALRARARMQESEGDLAGAAASLTSALSIGAGPTLADVRSLPALGRSAARLDEVRTSVQEQSISIELQLNRHREVIGSLTELAAQYPLREGLHEHLMLAQYRSGRTAESLKTYHKIHSAMVRELGMEPGERIRRLHQAILNQDPVIAHGQPHLVS